MSQLSDVQLALFCSQFLVMSFVAELGHSMEQNIMWLVLSGVSLVGAGYCLVKLLQRRSSWGEPA